MPLTFDTDIEPPGGVVVAQHLFVSDRRPASSFRRCVLSEPRLEWCASGLGGRVRRLGECVR
eukprot:3031577-Rhodomonas_salina.1